MDGSTSNSLTIKRDSDRDKGEIFNGGKRLVVCGCSHSCPKHPSFSHFFFSVLLVCCIPSFSAASAALTPPPTTALYTARTGGGGQRASDSKFVVVAVTVSVSLFFLCAMAYFACLRFRARRKTAADRRRGVETETVTEIVFDGVRRFSGEEVMKFSGKFSRSRVIAYGGFSTVYLGKLDDSKLAAIKIIDGSSERLRGVFNQELEILQKIRHENIVKILGFCDEEEQGTLFLEYVSNGTLQEKLHRPKDSTIPWKNRTKIAFQLAQALDYLHEHGTLQIVHGDIKASNILLDSEMNCKLCDFGSAKMGFSSTVLPPSSRGMIQMIGSPGYADPHYLRTGIASKKNDIYSFGIILLELITGLEAAASDSSVRLISKVGPMLRDASKVAEMVDCRLVGEYEVEEAMAMASLAALCLSDPPSLRPSASDIIETMRNCVASVNFLSSADKIL